MNKDELIKLGSRTARDGFKNEHDVINRFNDWRNDKVTQQWLKQWVMKYPISRMLKR